MNPKLLAILLAVFALCGVALFVTRDGGEVGPSGGTTPAHPAQEDAEILPAAAFDADLTAVNIAPHGMDRGAESSIGLDLIRGRWEVMYPHIFPADASAIDEFFLMLSSIQGRPADDGAAITREQAIHESLGGVIPSDPPSVSLSLWNDQRKIDRYRLVLGDRLGGGRALIEVTDPSGEATLYNTQDTLHELIENFEPGTFYPKRISPPLMPEVRRIEIATAEGRSVLTQDGGKWFIGEGETAERALAEGIDGHPGINNYFELFQMAELGEVQSYFNRSGLAKFGLEKPLITARFELFVEGGINDWTLSVGVPADPADQTRYIAWGPTDAPNPAVFTCPTPVALSFGLEATNFRDPRVIDTAISLIESIASTSPGGNLVLELHFATDGSAKLKAVPLNQDDGVSQQPLDPAKAKAMLSALTSARAIAFVNEPNEGALLICRSDLKARLSDQTHTLWVYMDPESDEDRPSLLVRRGHEKVLLRVDEAAVDALIHPHKLLADK